MDPDKHLRHEKHRARELRKTKWWRNKLSQGTCYYCNRQIQPDKLTMDHIIPISKGGHSIRSNIVASCKECNNKKTHKLPFEWKEYLESIEQ